MSFSGKSALKTGGKYATANNIKRGTKFSPPKPPKLLSPPNAASNALGPAAAKPTFASTDRMKKLSSLFSGNKKKGPVVYVNKKGVKIVPLSLIGNEDGARSFRDQAVKFPSPKGSARSCSVSD